MRSPIHLWTMAGDGDLITCPQKKVDEGRWKQVLACTPWRLQEAMRWPVTS